MTGGAGWDASQAGLPCASGGVGAIALLLGGGSPEVFLRASSTEGGQGGAAIGPCANGLQGLSESIVSGFIDVAPFGDNRIETPGPVRFGEPIEFHYEGLGGEYVFLLTSLKMDPVFFEVQNLLPVAILLPGTYLTDLSQTQIVNLGAATFVAPGQPGVLDKTFTAPDIGMQGLTFYVQAMAITPAAALPTVSVSNGLTLTLLDPAF